MVHNLSLRTSPGRSASDLRLSVNRCLESVATWFAGITAAAAFTALSRATAAAQSDLLPSGAVTSTTGIPSATRRARSSFCRRLICFFAFAIPDLCRTAAGGANVRCGSRYPLFWTSQRKSLVKLDFRKLSYPELAARNISGRALMRGWQTPAPSLGSRPRAIRGSDAIAARSRCGFPALNARTLDQLGAKMKCNRCGKRLGDTIPHGGATLRASLELLYRRVPSPL